jgi:hypothetical protein
VYGAAGQMSSMNFKDMSWWQQDSDGRVLDPYQLLVTELGEDEKAAEAINQGGAASNAYLRLQFEDLRDDERAALRNGLLRYCELDTLAMGFVLQSWILN